MNETLYIPVEARDYIPGRVREGALEEIRRAHDEHQITVELRPHRFQPDDPVDSIIVHCSRQVGDTIQNQRQRVTIEAMEYAVPNVLAMTIDESVRRMNRDRTQA